MDSWERAGKGKIKSKGTEAGYTEHVSRTLHMPGTKQARRKGVENVVRALRGHLLFHLIKVEYPG